MEKKVNATIVGEGGKNMTKKTILLIPAFFLLLALLIACIRIIDDGEVGIKKTLGNYDDLELGTGVQLKLPVIQQIYTVNTKTQTIEEEVSVPSQEGLIVGLDVSVMYSIKPYRASEIMQTVTGDIKDTLLIPYIRSGIRDTVAGYEAKAIYSEAGRVEVAQKLKEMLRNKLGESLNIQDVVLRDVNLPERVRNAIEEKIDAEQKAQKKEFELQAAKMDAEIDIERAKGISESNKIIAGSITPSYLKWKFIEALSLSGADVIYVPTEANLPILEAGKMASDTGTVVWGDE
ncbi:hypothetical protein GF351_02235 [Candidatus Woesearchaeota archaeon]|nr:hypothetical protein [Candidatus Woesearchaeota archaeon]